MNGDVCRSRGWPVRRPRTRICVLTHSAVGRVGDAGVHDDDGTLRWQLGMCQERTCAAGLCRGMYGTRDAT